MPSRRNSSDMPHTPARPTAVSAADMALAGVESRIPVDEVIDAMGDVGRRMPVEFRETALGGLATTPTGQEIKHCMNKKEE